MGLWFKLQLILLVIVLVLTAAMIIVHSWDMRKFRERLEHDEPRSQKKMLASLTKVQ